MYDVGNGDECHYESAALTGSIDTSGRITLAAVPETTMGLLRIIQSLQRRL